MTETPCCDAVIVGAGPSDAVPALALARAGMSATVLEQGGRVPGQALDGAGPAWELTRLRRWHPNPDTRGRAGDYPIDTAASDVNPLVFAGVGGAALIHGAHWVRFMASNFGVRSLDGVADDWPFGHDDLAPF